MMDISCKPIRIFLDFNAVIVNLDSLPKEDQQICLNNIEDNIHKLKAYLEENINAKENAPDIPEAGLAVLQQQIVLAQAIETWIRTVKG